MKLILLTAIVSISTSAFAFSSPLQLSKTILGLAQSAVSLTEGSQIRSVSANGFSASVSYINDKGACFVQRVPIKVNPQGLPYVDEIPLPPPQGIVCP